MHPSAFFFGEESIRTPMSGRIAFVKLKLSNVEK
jgi:hypothetical protein